MLPDAICHQFTNNVLILAFIFVGNLSICRVLLQSHNSFLALKKKCISFFSHLSLAGWDTSSLATVEASTC